jgi:hypothetical protein
VTAITRQYHSEFGCRSNYQIVGVNDMALPNGGVFDINQTWGPPHASHDRGNAVDFREKPGVANSVIATRQVIDRFLAICRENGLSFAQQEYPGQDNEHIHCATSSSGN